MAITLMFAALLVPILSVAVPPLTDYPNHLARCYVLAFGQSDPFLRQMFPPTGKSSLISVWT